VSRRPLSLRSAAACTLPSPAVAQGNDDDFTPLSSRIRRDRQFRPSCPIAGANDTSAVSAGPQRAMLNQFSRCVFNHSNGRFARAAANDPTTVSSISSRSASITDRAAAGLRFHGLPGAGRQHQWHRGAAAVQCRGLRQWLIPEAIFRRRYKDARAGLSRAS
jgi:hypothetical protein